jgi:hypothetical protein
MNKINLESIRQYVNTNIVDFHERRIKSLEDLKLSKLLNKNPYLFKAKNIQTAHELVSGLLEAFLSSSEEKLFGDFLEHLAVYIAGQTCKGHKSTAPGVDLEFFNDNTHFVVSVKSGTNWGNSSQQDKLEENLQNAVKRVKQSHQGTNVQPVLGICYGKTKTSYLRGYIKVVGQNFWYLISENKNLYTDIIEPIGYRAKEHNESFAKEKSRVINLFTKSFIDGYCDKKGNIDWTKLVKFNSGNYDPKTPIV